MSKDKAEYTPTEALKCLDGIYKNAFYKDMENGRVSYDERPWGKKKRRYIQGAELARAYQDKFKPQRFEDTYPQNKMGHTHTPPENIKTTHKNIDLEVEVIVLRKELELKNTEISFFKNSANNFEKDRDEWRTQAQTLLLQKPDSNIEKTPTERTWRFLGIFPRKSA